MTFLSAIIGSPHVVSEVVLTVDVQVDGFIGKMKSKYFL